VAADARLASDELLAFSGRAAWLDHWRGARGRHRAELIGAPARLARSKRRVHGDQRYRDTDGDHQPEYARECAAARAQRIALGVVEQASTTRQRSARFQRSGFGTRRKRGGRSFRLGFYLGFRFAGHL
jgi:hypothetical protein